MPLENVKRLWLLPVLMAPLAAQPAGFAGRWEGAVKLPGAELAMQVQLSTSPGGWIGTISIPQQGAKDLPLARIRVEGVSLEFILAGIPGDPIFRGVLKGGRIDGTLQQSGQTFPFTLSRPGPAQVQPLAPKDPNDRELAFPGFRDVTLKGSVRAATGHPWFAVLVAGSGPTDRNWSNPLIPKSSHAGRDFAAWLQAQGIGSLRYDKRFFGSRDPKLDVSLDAQVGDVAAALKAARGLPEAQGRKLLLVGHSEGALLALLQAREADAVLLLAMPGLPLAGQVLEQIRRQLASAGVEATAAKANLDHLTAVLEAVRAGRDLPTAGPEVLPGIAGLGRSLAQPGTLGFFRAVMDLDPWRLASRVTGPLAAAWGDRDVQCWKPVVPTGFPGAVIDLPGANHLLKRETRALAALDPAGAVDSYGDDTPQADLGPLAAWLKSLK